MPNVSALVGEIPETLQGRFRTLLKGVTTIFGMEEEPITEEIKFEFLRLEGRVLFFVQEPAPSPCMQSRHVSLTC